jgi:hypothetical protein
MVMRGRRVNMLIENMEAKTMGAIKGSYYLGSRSEGTTTSGLCSDTDLLTCMLKMVLKSFLNPQGEMRISS